MGCLERLQTYTSDELNQNQSGLLNINNWLVTGTWLVAKAQTNGWLLGLGWLPKRRQMHTQQIFIW